MAEHSPNDGLSRRAVMKKALTATAYVAPAMVTAMVPARVAAATPPPATADLSVTKTVDNPTPVIATNVTFTVTVTNNGPSAAAGVTVNDALPAGMTLVSATPTIGTYAGGVWTIGTLAAAQTVTLTLIATATGPVGTARTNTATVASGTTDPNLGNNSARVIVTPQVAPTADIAVTKTVNTPTPIVGSTVTFTATVRNNGPNAATGVVVSDPVPVGLTLVSGTPSQGTYNSATGVWAIGALAVGQVVTLTMIGTVGPGPVTNTASLTASSPTDPNPANNSASVLATPQPALAADIAVTKAVDNPTPFVGSAVTFTVGVRNNGPNAATGVMINDALPAGLTFVSAAPTIGAYSSVTGVWTVGALAVGQSATLTLVTTAAGPAGTARTNTATVAASSPPDPNPANDSASATVTPLAPLADIEVTKILATEAPGLGDNITFQLAVTNHGPSNATGVVVSDPIPANLSGGFALPPDQGTYDPVTGLWTIGSLTVGQAVTMAMTGTFAGNITNTATRTASSPTDPNPANDSASVTVTPPVLA